MLTIGDKLPSFALRACVSLAAGKEFQTVTDRSYNGKWQVLFFWPMDFTFVCPTEIIEFGSMSAAFEKNNAKLMGISTDSEFVHKAWRESHPGLKDLAFPMVADIKRELASALGILHKEAGVCLRATYIVDPEGTIRYASANDLSVGRNVPEVLRVLEALQTEKLTPCNWQPGESTLN